jgi:hypothetical protein
MASYGTAALDAYAPLTEAEAAKITTTEQEWSDSFALKIVCDDFSRAENYRSQNHDWRWQNADALYLGYVAQKFWEGTKIPRASIPVFTAYEQIESMVPRVVQALFGDNPWFEASPIGKTTPKAARVSRDTILAQMAETRIKRVVELALRSGLTYGNGILESSWLYQSQMVKKFVPRFQPQRRPIQHPITGQTFSVPSGGFDRVVVEVMEEEYVNRPNVETVSLKDFYIDPNCPTSDPSDARYTVKRLFLDLDYLKSLRALEDFTIPDDATLTEMAQVKPSTQGDNTKSWQESARMANWQPQVDQTADPGGTRVEVLIYKTDRRIVWVANRSMVFYNRPNPYGRKLQYNFCYTDLLDRFYGLAITDVVEGEQRLQEGVLNGRIDELALNIHPQTVVARSNTEPVYKLRVRPGGVTYSTDPKNDMRREYTQNVTQQAFMETAASDVRVQKITGQNDLVSGAQNPVARSATGAGLQGQATFSRSQYQVEKVEDNMLGPILTDVHMLNQHHLDPNQMIEAVDGQMIDPMEVFGAKVRFEMRAGSRMASRQGLLQVLPYIMQYAMNPQLNSQLADQGKTLDYEEIFQMLLDSTGYKKKATWIRDMTPQEQQALQAARQNPQNAELQKQRERMAQMATMQQNKGELDLTKVAIQARSDEKIALLDAKTKLETSGSD